MYRVGNVLRIGSSGGDVSAQTAGKTGRKRISKLLLPKGQPANLRCERSAETKSPGLTKVGYLYSNLPKLSRNLKALFPEIINEFSRTKPQSTSSALCPELQAVSLEPSAALPGTCIPDVSESTTLDLTKFMKSSARTGATESNRCQSYGRLQYCLKDHTHRKNNHAF